METKQCITCQQVLPVSGFHQRPCKGGFKPIGECITCRRNRSKKRHSENVERHRALVKKRYDEFGRFDRYGITAEDYQKALADQGGRCKLCGTFAPGGKGVWSIDHRHDTGSSYGRNGWKQGTKDQFRGLLCGKCNVSLGHFESLVDRVGLDAISAYLKIHIEPE